MISVHYPAKREERDQTGLTFAGRHEDGRYIYRSLSVLHNTTAVALTHPERVGLAMCRELARAARPRLRTAIYPMTMGTAHRGYGTYGEARLWLKRSLLGSLGATFLAGDQIPRLEQSDCLDVLAHEMGHNAQVGKPGHGSNFQAAEVKMRVALKKVIAQGWPKLNMAKLRDSVGPGQRKKKAKVAARAAAAAETGVDRWTKKRDSSAKRVEHYTKEVARMEKLLARAEKDERRAKLFLEKAKAREAQS
jgi:hypothetical protein